MADNYLDDIINSSLKKANRGEEITKNISTNNNLSELEKNKKYLKDKFGISAVQKFKYEKIKDAKGNIIKEIPVDIDVKEYEDKAPDFVQTVDFPQTVRNAEERYGNKLETQKDDPLIEKGLNLVSNIPQLGALNVIYNKIIDSTAKQIYNADAKSANPIIVGYPGKSWNWDTETDINKERYYKEAKLQIDKKDFEEALKGNGEKNWLRESIEGAYLPDAYKRLQKEIEPTKKLNSQKLLEEEYQRLYNKIIQPAIDLGKKDWEKIKPIAQKYSENVPELSSEITPKEYLLRNALEKKYGESLKPEISDYNPKVGELTGKVRTADILNVTGADKKIPLPLQLAIGFVGDSIDITLPLGAARAGLSWIAGKTGKVLFESGKKTAGKTLMKMGDKIDLLKTARYVANKTQDPAAFANSLTDDMAYLDLFRKQQMGGLAQYADEIGKPLKQLDNADLKNYIIADSERFIAGKTPIGEGAIASKGSQWWKKARQGTYKAIKSLEDNTKSAGKTFSSVAGRPFLFDYDLNKNVLSSDLSDKAQQETLNLVEKIRQEKNYIPRETAKEISDIIKDTGIERIDRLPFEQRRQIFDALESELPPQDYIDALKTGDIEKSQQIWNNLSDEVKKNFESLPTDEKTLDAIYQLKNIKDVETQRMIDEGVFDPKDKIQNYMAQIEKDSPYRTKGTREVQGSIKQKETLIGRQEAAGLGEAIDKKTGNYNINKLIEYVEGDAKNNIPAYPEKHILSQINDARILDMDSSKMPKFGDLLEANKNGKLVEFLDNYDMPNFTREEYLKMFNGDAYSKLSVKAMEQMPNSTLRDVADTHMKFDEFGKEIRPEKYDPDSVASFMYSISKARQKVSFADDMDKLEKVTGGKFVRKIDNNVVNRDTEIEKALADGLVPFNEKNIINAFGDIKKEGAAKQIRVGADYYVKPEVIDAMNNYKRNYGAVVSAINRYTQELKTVMTVYKPEATAFVTYNGISGQLIHAGLAKNKFQYVLNNARSASAIAGKDPVIYSKLYGKIDSKKVIDELDKRGALGTLTGDVLGANDAIKEFFRKPSMANLTPQVAAKEAAEQLGKELSAYATIIPGVRKLPGMKSASFSDSAYSKAFRYINEKIELENKLAASFSLLEQGKSFDEVADKIKWYYIDYTRNTPFMKTVGVNAIAPFITFARNTARQILTDPMIQRQGASFYRATKGAERTLANQDEDINKNQADIQARNQPFTIKTSPDTTLDTSRFSIFGLANPKVESGETVEKDGGLIKEALDTAIAVGGSLGAPAVNLVNLMNGKDRLGKKLKPVYIMGEPIRNPEYLKSYYFFTQMTAPGMAAKNIAKYFPKLLSPSIDPYSEYSKDVEQPKVGQQIGKIVMPRLQKINKYYSLAINKHMQRSEILSDLESQINRDMNKITYDEFDVKKDEYNTNDLRKIDRPIPQVINSIDENIKRLDKAIEIARDQGVIATISAQRIENFLKEPLNFSNKSVSEKDAIISEKKIAQDRLESMKGQIKNYSGRIIKYQFYTKPALENIKGVLEQYGTNTK